MFGNGLGFFLYCDFMDFIVGIKFFCNDYIVFYWVLYIYYGYGYIFFIFIIEYIFKFFFVNMLFGFKNLLKVG